MESFEITIAPIEVDVSGQIVSSNFAEVREAIEAGLGSIELTPKTDEEFGTAAGQVKGLKLIEKAIGDARDKALKNVGSVSDLLNDMLGTAEKLRSVRLTLEKAIAKRKEAIAGELVEKTVDSIASAGIERGLVERVYLERIRGALKGKRTAATIQKAAAGISLEVQGEIRRARENLEHFAKENGEDLIADRADLEVTNPEKLSSELRRRKEVAAVQKQRDAAKAETEKAKAEAEEAKRDLEEKGRPPDPDRVEHGQTGFVDLEKRGAEVQATEKISGTDARFLNAGAERQNFLALVRGAFVPLKSAREDLEFPENINDAAEFADSVGEAWKILLGKGGE